MKSIYPLSVSSFYGLILLLLCLSTLVMATSYIRPNTTITQWEACRLSVQHEVNIDPDVCLESDDYKKAKNEFEQLTQHDSECMKFNLLDESQEVTTDNFFINCYHSQEAKEVARSNQCFEKNDYSPIFIFCPKLETIDDITIAIWNKCTQKIINKKKSNDSYGTDIHNQETCFYDEQTKDAIDQQIFNVFQSQEIDSCQRFFDYSVKQDFRVSKLNFEGHYKKCYLSDKLLGVAKQDECYYKKYYIPMYVDCARLQDPLDE